MDHHPLEGMWYVLLVSAMVERIIEDDEIIVLQEQLGEWDNLNHLVICKKTNEAAIIDPFSGSFWLEICQKNNWNLNQVWLTHTHWDHCKGVPELEGCEIWAHEFEFERGWDGPRDHIWQNSPNTSVIQKLGNLSFEIHCTPGHTPGHTTIIGNGFVSSGDCLFLGRCGRTDLFGGDVKSQRKSLIYLKQQLQEVPANWLVLPGHQYPLHDGSNPTSLTVKQLLSDNEALMAVDDDDKWNSLSFLAFDDNMAEQARRRRAMNQ